MAERKKTGSKKARLTMARLAAVQCIYQWQQTGADVDDILDYYDHHYTNLTEDDVEILSPDRDLLSSILQGVYKQFSDLENVINQNIKKDDQAIEAKKDLILLACLFCGAYELQYHPQYDAALIISEYLHITASFYDSAEVKLVNGALDGLKTTFNR